MAHEGYVYILTNESFREDWIKIGKSSRQVDVRSKELDNTAVPLPFEIYATIKTTKYAEVERMLHKTIDRLSDLRVRQTREFFNIDPAVALDILCDIAKIIDDSVISIYEGGKVVKELPCGEWEAPTPTPQKKPVPPRRKRFKFSMVGIKPGTELTFDPTGIKVKVASDDQVEYESRLYKLSPFAGTFMPENMSNNSGAYQGAKYFSYNGQNLADLRDKLEQQIEHTTLYDEVSDKSEPTKIGIE